MRNSKKSIVRPPGNHYVDAISRQSNRSPIEVEKALEQYSNFVRVLKNCGLDVIKLESDTNPDSCFRRLSSLIPRPPYFFFQL